MTLKIGSKYILRFKINERDFVYTAIIKEDDGTLITFVDKYGREFSYSRNILITAEEIREDNSDGIHTTP